MLNLVVIRSIDMHRAAHFYRQLGIQTIKQRHGSGPEHYSAELGATVFEIYPLNDRANATHGCRLGFLVESLDEIIERLKALGVKISSPAQKTEWGRVTVVEDFDGHKIELTESA